MSCVCSALSFLGCSYGLPQGHPELSVPHVSVPDIRWVDWRALRAAGFKGCVFDKDNTLTEPYALEVHQPLAASMQHCMETFEGNIAVLSNSAGLQEFDPKGMSPEYRQPIAVNELGKACQTKQHLGILGDCMHMQLQNLQQGRICLALQ